MQHPAYTVLKVIAKERELTLGQVIKFLPTDFDDYRDLYPLATLFADGYLETNHSDSQDSQKTIDIVKQFYAMSLPEGTVKSDKFAEIKGIGWNDKLMFFCTAKTDIFFAERKSKIIERFLSLLTGIVIAVISATITVYLKNSVSC
jgi:hypothetical protein